MKHKLNDGGFSLVEVVLSMAILAIISIPLLNYFSDSMKYNAKMAQKQHATALAQEVLEGMKNENHLVQEVTPAAVSGTAYSVPSLTGKGYTEISNDMEVVSGSAVSGSAVYLGDGVMTGKDYDVVVKVNCSTPENEKDVAQVAALNPDTDVFAVENGQANEALTKFMAVNTSANTISPAAVTLQSEDWIKEHMKRKIKISISKSATAADQYVVKVTCVYSCSNLKAGEDETFECTPFVEQQLKDIKNIYLLYGLFYNKQSEDDLEVEIDPAITFTSSDYPKLWIVLQNNTADPYIGTGYTLNVTDNFGGGFLSHMDVATNLESPYSLSVGAKKVTKLVEYEPQTRKVNIEVSVYKERTGNTLGAEPYITVNAAKGE